MECLGMSKMKSWMLIMMMIGGSVIGIEGVCIEEERKALLQIKTSLIHPYDFANVDYFLPSWVDDGSIGGECCDWERVNCNTTTGHVTDLSLINIVPEKDYFYGCKRNWPLNVSVFLHFKELTSLNLSENCLDDGIVKTGLGRLSSLKKLETLDLSYNSITNESFSSLGALTSLRVLNLRGNELKGYFPALALENLEILDLSLNYVEGFDQVSLLKKLKVLNLMGNNFFNESFITSLSALPMLKSLDLSHNSRLYGRSFPGEAQNQTTIAVVGDQTAVDTASVRSYLSPRRGQIARGKLAPTTAASQTIRTCCSSLSAVRFAASQTLSEEPQRSPIILHITD
ncbi:hypothetical protein L6452_33548 [Arctium lappa]|uniref:Uncharacterized protein n=1 Tax=Arctium lappa TaxID=4217 RepID=A0ACB8YJX1_ARCLA|nr:hypothetical protein L6452_33548 [Arctium lappa]